MALIRNLSTPEDRAFWGFVDDTAREVRIDRRFHIVCGCVCKHGDRGETCDEVVLAEIGRVHPDDYAVEAWERVTTGGVMVHG